jgi:hypothetical protein
MKRFTKPWHIRINRYGRAFVPAPRLRFWLAIALLMRGWRPFENMYVESGRWWSKPSRNTRAMYPQPIATYFRWSEEKP